MVAIIIIIIGYYHGILISGLVLLEVVVKLEIEVFFFYNTLSPFYILPYA